MTLNLGQHQVVTQPHKNRKDSGWQHPCPVLLLWTHGCAGSGDFYINQGSLHLSLSFSTFCELGQDPYDCKNMHYSDRNYEKRKSDRKLTNIVLNSKSWNFNIHLYCENKQRDCKKKRFSIVNGTEYLAPKMTQWEPCKKIIENG